MAKVLIVTSSWLSLSFHTGGGARWEGKGVSVPSIPQKCFDFLLPFFALAEIHWLETRSTVCGPRYMMMVPIIRSKTIHHSRVKKPPDAKYISQHTKSSLMQVILEQKKMKTRQKLFCMSVGGGGGNHSAHEGSFVHSLSRLVFFRLHDFHPFLCLDMRGIQVFWLSPFLRIRLA